MLELVELVDDDVELVEALVLVLWLVEVELDVL